MPPSVLDDLLMSAQAQGAIVARPTIGASLGPRPHVSWLTILAVKTDPAEGLDALYQRDGASCSHNATCCWTAHHDPASGEAWVLLEAMLRAGDERRILVPFDDLGLHGQVLRDTITAGWLILLDASDPASLHALDRADFNALKAAPRLELPNLATGPLQCLFEGLDSGSRELAQNLDGWRREGPERAGEGLRVGRSTRRA